MGGLFKYLLWRSPGYFILIYLVMQNQQEVKTGIDKKEVKADIRVEQLEADMARIDAEFGDKNYNLEKAKKHEARAENLQKDLDEKEAKAKKLRENSEKVFNEMEKEANSFKIDEAKEKAAFENL